MNNKHVHVGWVVWSVLASIICVQAVHATAIVAIRTPTEIVVAADSKVRGDQGGIYSECKIGQVGNVFFAMAGLYKSPTGFSLYDISTKALHGKGTIKKKADTFAKDVQDQLIAHLKKMKAENPEYFRDMAQVAFFGLENGIPELHIRTREVIIQDPEKPMVNTLDEDCGADCNVDPYMTELGSFISTIQSKITLGDLNLIEAANNRVNRKIWRIPEENGPPIDILRITAKGAEWVQKKKKCPDVEK